MGKAPSDPVRNLRAWLRAMPTKRFPLIHLPARGRSLPHEQPPDPDTVRRLVGCRICHVPAGEFCLRVRRAGKEPIRRARNHQVRVVDAKKVLGG